MSLGISRYKNFFLWPFILHKNDVVAAVRLSYSSDAMRFIVEYRMKSIRTLICSYVRYR